MFAKLVWRRVQLLLRQRVRSEPSTPNFLLRTHSFRSLSRLGVWGSDAFSLSSEIGSRIAAITGEPRSTAFFRQLLDIAVQRGNSAAILETLPPDASTRC